MASSERNRSRACANVAEGGGSSQRSVARIGYTPIRQLQCQWREIGADDFWRCLRWQGGMLDLTPQSITHAGLYSSGTTATLVGRSARDAAQFQAAHAGRRIEPRAPFLAAIDDDAHAFDREAGLGDIGREHDLAFATAARLDRCVLLVCAIAHRTTATLARRAGSDASSRKRCARRISPCPGRNASTSPCSSSMARAMVRATICAMSSY